MVSLAVAVPLMADDSNPSGIRFGGMVSYTIPSGELSSGLKRSGHIGEVPGTKSGFGATLFAEKAFSDHTAGRLRLDYMTFGEKNDVFYSDYFENGYSIHRGRKGSASSIALMADYVYRLQSHDTGLFCFGGIGLMNAKVDFTYYIDDTWPYDNESMVESKSNTSTAFAIALGLSHNFNKNFGIEVKYTKGLGAKTYNRMLHESDPDPEPDNPYYYTLETRSIGFDFIQLSVSYRF
jgi:opacity protein-like surface antigen